jgi:protein tyrosine phosphatase (PTP) superfamily phosphohydrolase (DUF442 family)
MNINVSTKKILKKLFTFLMFLLVIVLLWAGYFFVYGNFHKVDKDVYRSAQLFSFNMPYYVKKYHIKSILNLRGTSKKEWYKNELAIAKKYHMAHYDYGIGDRRIATMKEMNTIIDFIKQAPKPLLIHCKMGADRTSLAVALYLDSVKKSQNASKAISIMYGHFPWLGSKTIAMDKSFRKFLKHSSQD